MLKMHILQVGSRVHVLVPWNALHNGPAILDAVESLPVDTAPSVFIPVNRG